MIPALRQWKSLEAAAIAAQPADLPLEHDPFGFTDEPGPHCRLVSAFAWHPLLRRSLGLPPIALFLLAWVSAALFHGWALVPQPWGDEAFTWSVIQLPWPELMQRLGHDLHPPLYFVLMKLAYGGGVTNFLQLRLVGYVPVALGLGLLPHWIRAWPRTYRRLGSLVALVLVLFPFDLYLLQLRYYGLLALALGAAIVALGNVLEPGEAPRRTRWNIIAAIAFAIAAGTNYQSYAVWLVATLAACGWARHHRDTGVRWQPILGVQLGVLVAAHLVTVVVMRLIGGVDPLEQLHSASVSPFTSGFTNLIAEVMARLGVLGLCGIHSEFVPLWWVPAFGILCGLAVWRAPRVVQSGLSPTAWLCAVTALGMALVMAVLTATVLSVGVEFLPARLAYIFPLASIALTEWLLKRTSQIRWPLALLACNLLVLGAGYEAASQALLYKSPSPPAPFLHATYLTPAPALIDLLAAQAGGAEDVPEPFAVVFDDVGTEFALRARGWYPPQFAVSMLDFAPEVVNFMPGQRIAVITSTRDITPQGERATWEAWLQRHATYEEQWQFVHEDPAWLWLKRSVLQRDVEPYKKQVRFFHLTGVNDQSGAQSFD